MINSVNNICLLGDACGFNTFPESGIFSVIHTNSNGIVSPSVDSVH